MTSSKYPDIVRCETFGDFLGRFGPLVADAPLPDLISRVSFFSISSSPPDVSFLTRPSCLAPLPLSAASDNLRV